MVSQIVCGLQGAVYDVVIGKGHNNDQAMFILSGMKFHTELNLLNLLTDQGYRHHRITTLLPLNGKIMPHIIESW